MPPRKKELHTDDLEISQRSPIILPSEGPIVREPEEIVVAGGAMNDDYSDELAFNEEELIIRVERSPEKHAPKWVSVGVNGPMVWIPVGVPYRVKRKHVEVLARSKPETVKAYEVQHEGENPENLIDRSAYSQHPFSVISDPNPRGAEWLTNLMHDY